MLKAVPTTRPAHTATLALTEDQRHAYNAAFEELSLPWHWDASTFTRVMAHGESGLRHYLDGILVMPGLSLQLQLVDGQWLEGKYEWTYDEGKPAQFLLLLAGDGGRIMFPLPPAALFRVPLS